MTASSHHRPDLDGLRGLAVVLVLVFHAWPSVLPGGFVGVDVFFVISGFVVTQLLQRELAANQFTVRRFFTRRVNRLAPALLLVTACTIFAAMRWLSPTLLTMTAGHALTGLTSTANLLHAVQAGYFDAVSGVKPLLHLWSLSVEEQFYVAVALAVAVGVSRRWKALPWVWGLLVLSFIGCVALTFSSAKVAFFLPFTRAWELLAGVLVALRGERLGRTAHAAAGLVLVLGTAVLLDGAQPGWLVVLPVVGTSMLLATRDTWVGRALSRPALVWLGGISYPLYLWHWPLLTFGRLSTPVVQHHVVGLVAVLASVVLAAATSRWLERPIRVAQRVSTAVAALAVSLGLVALSADAMLHADRYSSRGPLVAEISRFEREYDFATDARLKQCWLVDDAVGGFEADCIDTAPAAGRLVYVWGDSHAARLTAGLRALQAERPTFRLAQRTRSSCPPVAGVGVRACRESFSAHLEELERLAPQVVVLGARWRGLPSLEPLKRTLAEVKRRVPGARIQVVGPMPEWQVGLPWVLTLQVGETLPERLVPETFAAQQAFDEDVRSVVSAAGVEYHSSMQSLCTPIEGCLVTLSRQPLMLTSWDYGHLTTPAAKVIARRVASSW